MFKGHLHFLRTVCSYLFTHFANFSKFRNSSHIRAIFAFCYKCCKYFCPFIIYFLTVFFKTTQHYYFQLKIQTFPFIASGFSVIGKFPLLSDYKEIHRFFSSYLEGFIFTVGFLIHSDFIRVYSVRNRFNFMFFHIVKHIYLNSIF